MRTLLDYAIILVSFNYTNRYLLGSLKPLALEKRISSVLRKNRIVN